MQHSSQHSSSPHESLFVPTDPRRRRGAPVAGILVLLSGLVLLMLGFLNTWADPFDDGSYSNSTIYTYSIVMLLMGFLTMIVGIVMTAQATRLAYLLVSLSGLLVGALGGYQIYYVHRFNASGATMRRGTTTRAVIMSTEPGVSLITIGVLLLLIMAGSFLHWRWWRMMRNF